jgi:flagellar M-ring protein FliF
MATTVANPADMNLPPATSGGNQASAKSTPTAGVNAGRKAAGNSAADAPSMASGLSLASVQGVMAQPAVKKSLPAIMALLTLAVFIIAYSWVQQKSALFL